MACVPEYLYSAVFEQYGLAIRAILLDQTTENKPPFPVYESREEYDADVTNAFKGLLVWNAQRYYSGLTDNPADYESYPNNIGFFIVPEFGNVNIVPNVEFKQYITFSFDSNSEPDFDPYGTKIIALIDWFINKHQKIVEDINSDDRINLDSAQGPETKPLWCMLEGVSKPIYSNSLYVRRNVTEVVRYCRCS